MRMLRNRNGKGMCMEREIEAGEIEAGEIETGEHVTGRTKEEAHRSKCPEKELTPLEKALKERKEYTRMSGILLHPTSLPSRYGIGDLGKGAEDFIDFLAASHQHLWQTLPLGPTGFGDSPYQAMSAFAGQPYIISPDLLKEDGLLDESDLWEVPQSDPRRVDYGKAIAFKMDLLRKAYEHFCRPEMEERFLPACEAFVERERYWLPDYALFMAVKEAFGGRCWLDWDADIRDRKPEAMAAYAEKEKDEIRFFEFVQFLFDRQWNRIRLLAAQKDIWIIGDIPIFMSLDCADLWAQRNLFRLDSRGYPLEVAGVPPDYFSATGQLWGNPLYDWAVHKETGFAWWIARIRRQMELSDYVRIDHFRAFESGWAVPYGDETAEGGKWVKGPGAALFTALQKKLGRGLPIIAEDLGIITPRVEALRDRFGFPGMKVLQFGFGDMNDRAHIPHMYTTTNCVCYTGTHDNETTTGWYTHQPEEVKDRIRLYGNCDGGGVSLDFIRFAMASVARFALFPMQDVLQLGNEARMNTPGAPSGNWTFRYEQGQLEGWRRDWLARYTRVFARE